MLDTALELIGYDELDSKRADAESRGKLLGLGIGSTLDSGTNNFGQSRLINPELQFSGNNEVATVKLDIFGEIVVTLGTTPQGQSHETTASQVVADILGCSVDDVNVRAGHDSYWNSHAGFSGTYASQFAVTGLGAVKGATEMLAGEMKQARLGRARLLGRRHRARRGPGADEGQPRGRAAVHGARRDHQREQRRAARGPRRDAELPLRLPAAVRPAGRRAQVRQPDADLRRPGARGGRRDRSRDRRLRDRRLRGRGRLRQADQPAGGRGPGDGRDRAGDRRRDARDLHLRRGREPADAQLLRLPRPARARHAAAQDRLRREPVAVHVARHEGHGRGRRRRDPRGLRRAAGRAPLARERRSSTTAATRTTASGSCSPIPTRAGKRVAVESR